MSVGYEITLVVLVVAYLFVGWVLAAYLVESKKGSESDTRVAWKAVGMNLFWAPVLFFEGLRSVDYSKVTLSRLVFKFYGD